MWITTYVSAGLLNELFKLIVLFVSMLLLYKEAILIEAIW